MNRSDGPPRLLFVHEWWLELRDDLKLAGALFNCYPARDPQVPSEVERTMFDRSEAELLMTRASGVLPRTPHQIIYGIWFEPEDDWQPGSDRCWMTDGWHRCETVWQNPIASALCRLFPSKGRIMIANQMHNSVSASDQALQRHTRIGERVRIDRTFRLDQRLSGADLSRVVCRGDTDHAAILGQVHGGEARRAAHSHARWSAPHRPAIPPPAGSPRADRSRTMGCRCTAPHRRTSPCRRRGPGSVRAATIPAEAGDRTADGERR